MDTDPQAVTANPFTPWLATYGPGAVAERPWWTGWPAPGHIPGGWSRRDGWVAEFSVAVPPDDLDDGRIRLHAPHQRTREEMLAEIDRIDAEHPLPVPPPMCGQAWQDAFAQFTIAAVDLAHGLGLIVGGDGLEPVEVWPPPGAVLVSGPFAPWAPAGWTP